MVHHMGQALALAIETNRTLVMAPDVGYPYTEPQRCSASLQDGPSAVWWTGQVHSEYTADLSIPGWAVVQHMAALWAI